MRTRIWEDTAAMNIVSVLGFLMNDDGDVVGPERTQVLCKLLPSIHTLTHRAILAMLVAGLNDADAQTFHAEKGLRVLNEWLLDGLKKAPASSVSREKLRVEMFSQVRALLRILDVNVQTDAARKQHAYLCVTLVKLSEFLDNSSPDFAADWSRVNIYRRHFESSCGVPSTAKDTARAEPKIVASNGARASAKQSAASGAAPSTSSSSGSAPTPPSTSTSSSSTASASAAPRISPSAVLAYQPKAFLQPKDNAAADDDAGAYVDDEDEDLVALGEDVITNVTQPAMSAGLESKIRNHGHRMHYVERMHCRLCRRMTAKRCEFCNWCVKCAQKDKCANAPSAAPKEPSATALSVSDRNVQVLGSAMDQAIFKAFKSEDFYAVFSLVQNGMDVNFQRVESDHSTALMAAAYYGREDAVNKLLSLGANPTLKDSNGDAAWTFAKRRGHTELANKLKQAADEWKE
ncbi:hypothetical protein ATCC90586_005390 [Pythium insidiosum]|nr:hypothetical protein ATCC90586_005390 [Pythium insidiosum]